MEDDGDTESEYRIQVNSQVKYIVVQPGVYDLDDILSFPPALLEKLEGRIACIEDISACEVAVRRLHTLGVIHGDLNRHNFVVDKHSGNVHLIDFENAEDYSNIKATKEIDSLKDQLKTQGEVDKKKIPQTEKYQLLS